MKVFRLSKVFDFLFGVSFLFLICFIWSRYFLQEFWITLVTSSFFTFLIVSLFHISQKNISNKKMLTELDGKNAKAISTNFLLQTKQETLKTFEQKLSRKYDVKLKSDFLIVNKNILRPIFNLQTITSKEIFETYTKTKDINCEKLIIVCKNASPEAKDAAKYITNKKCIILEQFEAFDSIYKPLNFDVPNVVEPKKSRKNLTEYLSFALNKSRTKNYLLVSAFMLFSSFVLRYNIYYIVFASITTLLALYSHFNTRFNKQDLNIMEK